MNASELLATVAKRGGTARAEIGTDGAAVLVVAPREAIGDLLPDLKRLKPDLLELLTAPLTGSGVHRWPEPPAPDVAALVRELEAARRGIGKAASGGAWVIPSAPLLSLWRQLQAYTGAKLTARHLGALARLRDERAQLDNGALLDLWAAGLLPDRGGGAAVWVEPERKAEAMRARAKRGAQTSAPEHRRD